MIQTSTITPSITGSDGGALDLYLRDMSRNSKVITPDKEVELAMQIKKGNVDAKHELIKANLRFVVSVAKVYRNRGLDLPDLINAGNIGMIKSIEKFDETRGFKFISHSVHWIRSQMLRSLAEETKTIRIPLNKNDSFNRIKKFIEKFHSFNERYPIKEEISENLKWVTSVDIDDFYLYYKRHKSLDEPLSEEAEATLLDLVSGEEIFWPDRGLVLESLDHEVRVCLESLSGIEETVIRKVYGIGCEEELSLKKIALELDFTEEGIRQIKLRALRKLRRHDRKEKLRKFL